MSNPLYPGPQMPNGIMQRFQQFQRMFRGNPKEQVQQLLNSGRVTQNDYNRAVQMANQFMRMMGGK